MEINDVDRQENIPYDGMALTIKRPDFETEKKFALMRRDKAVAMAAAYANNTFLFRTMIDSITAGFASGEYDWSGDIVKRAREQEEGFKDLMFLILLQKNNPQSAMAITREVFDDQIWPVAREEFIAAWSRLQSPTPQTPPPVKK